MTDAGETWYMFGNGKQSHKRPLFENCNKARERKISKEESSLDLLLVSSFHSKPNSSLVECKQSIGSLGEDEFSE